MIDSGLPAAMANLDESEALKIVREKIENHVEPETIINELQEGMSLFGEKYKSGNYFIGDLILSGEIFNQSMKLLEPHMAGRENITGKKVKMVLGTVKGDIHNLGKDIVAVLLKASGFEVYDLGINIPPDDFVRKLQQTGASILGLSGLITPSFESMKETVAAVEAAGLREKVKIIIGGGVVDNLVKEYTGADAFSTDAMEGIGICKRLAKEVRYD
jgi:methanogenic corrinoid protein MtbC1